MTKPAEVKKGVRWLYYLLFLLIFMDYFDELQGNVPFASDNELFLAAIVYLLQLGLYQSVSNGKNWARVISVSINILFIASLAIIFYSTGYNLVGTTYSFASITGLSGFYQADEFFAGAYIVCFIILLMNSTVPLLSQNATNWFKGTPVSVPFDEFTSKSKSSNKTSKPKSSKITGKNDAAAKEFVMETIRNLDYVVTRKILTKYIKSDTNARNLYAYLYGIALFTWSLRVTMMNYKDFKNIFNLVDNALKDSGIKIPRHLDLDDDFDEISAGFDDIFAESIGIDSIQNDDDLIASVNKDFQSVGIYYARAYSKDDKQLSRVYFVKLVNNITENT